MSQISIFDGGERLRFAKPIRLIELFAGIGSQAKAFERLGIPFEHYRICEFDKYAVTSYNAVHGTDFATSDITALKGADLGIVDIDKYDYVMTYSFPCQDLSICGEGKGMAEGSGTRSALLWEVKRLLFELDELPQILVMENVPQVIGAANRKHFAEWVAFLDSLGYTSKWQVMNSKEYGVPQNRDRCFMVSWLGDYYYDFPEKIPLTKLLRDMLQPEDEVDEKYYLSEKGVKFILEPKRLGKYTQLINEETDYVPCALTAKGNSNWTVNFVQCEPQLVGGFGEKKSNGGTQWDDFVVYDLYNKNQIDSDVLGTITSGCARQGSGTFVVKDGKSPFRKLTQLECWRLMDFDDADFYRAREALNNAFYNGADRSGSQLYKQAGNSIVVACLEAIFRQMI